VLAARFHRPARCHRPSTSVAASRQACGHFGQCIYTNLPGVVGVGPERVAAALALPGARAIRLPDVSHRDPTNILPAAAVAIRQRNFEHDAVKAALDSEMLEVRHHPDLSAEGALVSALVTELRDAGHQILQQILVRVDAPTSASTLLRELHDPAARLFDAVQRYTDGLHVAAEQLLGPEIVQMLDDQADQLVPELTSEPSWPTLRAHLLTLSAETGEHPLLHLQTAAAGRDLQTAGDMAAVLDWRLPEPASTDSGPLPWLPGTPQALQDHHVWGQYLGKRSQLVTGLANQIRDCASQNSEHPVWAPPGQPPERRPPW
jgi:hypothetical protein